METDNSIIIGPKRPIIGETYTYVIREPNIAVTWEIWRGDQCIKSNATGKFTFLDISLDEGFVIRVKYYVKGKTLNLKEWLYAKLAVKPLSGKPEFVEISWQDANLEDIGNKRVEYLDDIYLTVRTANIAKGKRLSAKIIDTSANSAGEELYAYVDEHSIARFKVSSELLKRFAEKFCFEDTIHNYCAEIKYFDSGTPYGVFSLEDLNLTVVEKSEILSVANSVGQAIPSKNGVKPVMAEDDKSDEERKNPIKIKLNVFFDGTRNNRENVKSKEDERAKLEKDNEKEDFDKQLEKEDSSYSQSYSNIAIMQWSDAFNKGQNKNDITVYIEGAGTMDLQEDDTFGLVTGAGDTGIKAKAEKALNEILKERKEAVKKNEYVAEVKVNVFGFSRGAATARHFVSTKRSEIALNLNTSKANVIFIFVGLFDTVSAYGKNINFSNDTKELSLDMGGKAKKVLQLKALDEYREKFNLTDITSSIQAGVGYELGLPGAHSDIGGGFRNPETETVTRASESLADWLIEEGWHIKKEKIDGHWKYMPGSYTGVAKSYIPATYKLERTIPNHYQYIPLTIMVNFAQKYGKMSFIEEMLNEYYDKIPKELTYFQEKFVKEADGKNGARSTTVEELSKTERNDLRHNYLHLTAFREGGQEGIEKYLPNKGRYDKNDLPKRKIISG